MRISHNTRIDLNAIDPSNGYGYATDRMRDSLARLGYEVNNNDPKADVGFWFDQPQHWKWPKGQYRIGYHPWESTGLKKSWIKAMNKCDEIWTPSPVIAQWYKEAGVKRPVFVYEHGVDHMIWQPYKRTVNDKIRILHVGAEALRKGGGIALDAFRCAAAGRKDIELTLKMNTKGWGIKSYGNVRVITDKLPINDLVTLYNRHHIFLYPSWGEGFGLTPLQAMATGMPTITVPAWAPYKRFIPEFLGIESKLADSPWPESHPGKMFKPNFDHTVDILRYTLDNYKELENYCRTVEAPQIRDKYDWDILTSDAFYALENRLK